MKVIPFKIPQTTRLAFRVQEDKHLHFYDSLHQHPEIQITLVLKSEGVLIAGDYLGNFEAGDVFVLGSNLPHVFRNDDSYFQENNDLHAEAITLFFDATYLGEAFWNLTEMLPVRTFVHQATHGFRLVGQAQLQAAALLQRLVTQEYLDKLLCFFELLKVLSETTEVEQLALSSQSTNLNELEGKRMNEIFQFTFRESHRTISIVEVAQVANLSPEAFCRYFKLRTRKTYINFLNEVRISNACKLLLHQDLPVSDVCYQVGFQNLSNFNRVFKKVVGKTPREFAER
ncbi:MAG: AraC family transcriptional regulator [Spirosomataceae bacterium]